jgi:hypothetical protein
MKAIFERDDVDQLRDACHQQYTNTLLDDIIKCNAVKCLEYVCSQCAFGIVIERETDTYEKLAASLYCVIGLTDMTPCEMAASLGMIECLPILYQYGYSVDIMTCCFAAYHGHLDCLQYAMMCSDTLDWRIGVAALMCSNTTCLRFIHTAFPHLLENVYEPIIVSADAGTIECTQYLLRHQFQWNRDACVRAAMFGHFDYVKFVIENKLTISDDICARVITLDRLDILQYLHEHGANWNGTECKTAAFFGYADNLQYAHEHGCPIDDFDELLDICVDPKCISYLTKCDASKK